MAKMLKKITQLHEYAIRWLNHTGLSNTDISKQLNIDLESINRLIQLDTDAAHTPKSKAKNLMITHTSGKKINSVAIMTQEASEICDAAKKAAPTVNNNKGIFRPKA